MSENSPRRIYDRLSAKLGKDTTEDVVTLIEQNVKSEMEKVTKTLATKDDISSLKEDINSLKEFIFTFRDDIRKDFSNLKEDFSNLKESFSDLKDSFSGLREETRKDILRLDVKITETKVEMIQWMVGVAITIVAVFIGLYFRK